jgi:hypothetical protein
MLYTYDFYTYQDAPDSGPIQARYSVPMRGFDNESEAWEAFTKLPYFTEVDGFDFWYGYPIGAAIVCDATKENNEESSK